MSKQVEIGSDVQRLIGRKIVAAEREPPSKDSWPMEDQSLTITLDDGSIWRFEGWGYDACGLQIYVTDAD